MSLRKSHLLLALPLALALQALICGPLFAATAAGRISDAEGAAEITRQGAKEPELAAENTDVFAGDALETGEDGKLKVQLADGSVLTLAESTRFTLSESRFDAARGTRQSIFDLLAGKVRAEVARVANAAKSRFEIRTPTAVAGVRGTTYEIEHDESSGESGLYMYEGSADWADRKGTESVLVDAGHMSQLRPGQKLRKTLFSTEVRKRRAALFILSERAKRRRLRRIERRGGRQERRLEREGNRLERREEHLEKRIENREDKGLRVPERLERREERLENREENVEKRQERAGERKERAKNRLRRR